MEQSTFELLMAAVIGSGIIPLVGQLKKTKIVEWVRPEFITAVLAVGLGFALAGWLMPEATATEIIKQALQAVGVTSVAYGGWKAVKK